jgi:hypothetical protein
MEAWSSQRNLGGPVVGRWLQICITLMRSRMKVRTKYIHTKSTTVYVPSSELELSHPLSRLRVCPSLRNQRGGGRGGHTRVRVRIRGSPNYNDRRKNLALCLLCVGPHQSEKPNPQRFCQGRFPRGAITFKIVRFLRPLDKRN